MRLETLGRLAVLLVALSASAAGAGDGRIEISQTKVDAAGGFPYTISQPGSYVLTSDLLVPPGADGVQLQGNDLHLDLNGFRIQGSFTCSSGACTPGPTRGIFLFPSAVLGRRIAVRNGVLRGFSGNCLTLGMNAHVTGVVATDCGGAGISLGDASLAESNRVRFVGREGIVLGARSAYAHNVVSDASLSSPLSYAAIGGGRATADNVCGDTACRVHRRFYLTTDTYDGAQADAVCAIGFRLANQYELQHAGDLEISGLGPTLGGGPSGVLGGGWVWVGGFLNCCGFSDTSCSGTTLAWLGGASGWVFEQPLACTSARRVWCIEE
jgi:hypothetical protein